MRRQEIIVSRASKYIAITSAVISAVEDLSDEIPDVLSVSVPWWLVSPWETLAEAERSKNLKVHIGIPEKGNVYEEYLEDIDLSIEVIGDPELKYSSSYKIKDLYRKATLSPISLDSRLIRRLAIETSTNNIEFMFLYLRTGSLAVLEGEHLRVSIPLVEISKVTYHTHPHGACGLSIEDLRSLTQFLVNGGLGGAAATDSCVTYMTRYGFVCEEDFIKLRRLTRPLVLGEPPPKFKSVEIGFMSY